MALVEPCDPTDAASVLASVLMPPNIPKAIRIRLGKALQLLQGERAYAKNLAEAVLMDDLFTDAQESQNAIRYMRNDARAILRAQGSKNVEADEAIDPFAAGS